MRRLAERLHQAGLAVFYDEWEVGPGDILVHQLERGLLSANNGVLAVTPAALARPWVQQEYAAMLTRALEGGFRLIPVLLADVPMPPLLGSRVWVDLRQADGPVYEEKVRELVAALRGERPGPPPRIGVARSSPETDSALPNPAATSGVTAIPRLPHRYLGRAQDLERLKAKLLSREMAHSGVAGRSADVGIQGMGGIGKTVLAAALVADREVREAFPDGIFWVVVGQRPDLTQIQADLIDAAGAGRRLIDSPRMGMLRLQRLLEDRSTLLVLDDVWHLDHAAAFDVLGERGRLLVTTRDAAVVVGLGAWEHQVDVLSLEDALALLALWAEQEVASLPPMARRVAEECGCLPLALAMIGAMVRRRPTAWEDVFERLVQADLGKIRRNFPGYPYPDLLRALAVSVEALDPDERLRYLDLAVFRAGAAVPESVLETLWGPAGLPGVDARDLIAKLVDRSLVQRRQDRKLGLHDLQADYVCGEAGDLPSLHDRLVEAYSARCGGHFANGPNDGYFFQNLAWHLFAAGREEELRSLLFDFSWLRAKLAATGINDLLRNYDQLASEPAARKVQGVLRLAAHVLALDADQLAGQLLGRLDPAADALLQQLVQGARSWHDAPWLRPKTCFLRPPETGLLRTFAGHTESIHTILRLDHRRVISAANDRTLRIWDVDTGMSLQTLQGHTETITSIVPLDQRRIVSGSWDGTLRIWDLESGEALHTLTGHRGAVLAVARLDDRRAVSGSLDHTLRIWDVDCGETLRILKGHASVVDAVARFDDRRLISGAADSTLRVWDVETGQMLHVLEGHRESVLAVVPLNERHVVSASADHTLRVWDVDAGQALRVLEGHRGEVGILIRLAGDRVVSGSKDHTLRVWDTGTGETLHILKGHDFWIKAAVPLDDRHLVSTSSDGARIWDIETGKALRTLEDGCSAAERLDDGHVLLASHAKMGLWDVEARPARRPRREMHAGAIRAIAWLDRRRLVSASSDHTLRIWDVQSGKTLHVLEGHTASVSVAVRLESHRILSGSVDGTLRVWDAESGHALRTLRADSQLHDPVLQVLPIDGRRVVSTSESCALYFWDVELGVRLDLRGGHAGWVEDVAPVDRHRIVSASRDETLRVWDFDTRKSLRTLQGHDKAVVAVARIDERRVVSASEDCTLRGWDVNTGKALWILQGHTSTINAVACLDGRRVASASDDYTLRIWDVETGQPVETLRHTSEVLRVARLDHRRILSTCSDGTLRVWDVATAQTVACFTLDVSTVVVEPMWEIKTIAVGDRSGQVHFLALEEP